MITVFSRGSAAATSGNSLRFEPGAYPGASFLDSGQQTALRIKDLCDVHGDGLTFSTWVKPNWDNQTQGAPAYFMALNAPAQSPSNQNYIARFGYDSETTQDSIFLFLQYYVDAQICTTWINAPLGDATNEMITGLNPNMLSQSGTTNRWNSVSSPGFVHIAVVLDMLEPAPVSETVISPRAKIFWNGQVLNTYENWSGNLFPSLMNLQRFIDVSPILTIGPEIWNRDHWQDRPIFNTDRVTASNVYNYYYASLAPSDPPPTADFHWNFENGTAPYTSNGVGNPITMTGQAVSPGVLPIRDSNYFV
jgi:hypothetical protein